VTEAESPAHPFRCSSCGRTQPLNYSGGPCPVCGGVLELSEPLVFNQQQLAVTYGADLWRYRHTLPLPPEVEPVTLGEGGTPLVAVPIGERFVRFKLEFTQPTGSFKDRGSAVLLTALRAAGVEAAVEDSSGNAGASFAAYAARAGMAGRVFVPAAASGPKLAQIAAYGAEVVPVEGPRSQAAEAARRAAAQGAQYASHNYNPIGMAGIATLAYEIWEQLGRAPESLLLPVGHGTLLLGLHLGFKALLQAGLIGALPRLVGVQAMACAPLWAVHRYGREGLGWVTEGETAAEGIRILRPVRGDAVLAAVEESQGSLLAVEEDDIVAGRNALARMGFYVEPTSAVVWPALAQVPGDVVVVLTGSGLKSPAA
jgi:threonine synthase